MWAFDLSSWFNFQVAYSLIQTPTFQQAKKSSLSRPRIYLKPNPKPTLYRLYTYLIPTLSLPWVSVQSSPVKRAINLLDLKLD